MGSHTPDKVVPLKEANGRPHVPGREVVGEGREGGREGTDRLSTIISVIESFLPFHVSPYSTHHFLSHGSLFLFVLSIPLPAGHLCTYFNCLVRKLSGVSIPCLHALLVCTSSHSIFLLRGMLLQAVRFIAALSLCKDLLLDLCLLFDIQVSQQVRLLLFINFPTSIIVPLCAYTSYTARICGKLSKGAWS